MSLALVSKFGAQNVTNWNRKRKLKCLKEYDSAKIFSLLEKLSVSLQLRLIKTEIWKILAGFMAAAEFKLLCIHVLTKFLKKSWRAFKKLLEGRKCPRILDRALPIHLAGNSL
jgi:hypothetical protein